MSKPQTKAILEAAVKTEEQSITLYTMAQKRVDAQSSKKFLRELAREEQKHREKLLAMIKDEKKLSELGSQADNVQDLKIVDVMKDPFLSEEADYSAILVYAAKREKVTYDYYASLAKGLEGTEAGELFSRLAQEELTHKSKLEREYDEYLLKEN
jgi:rubrerythrin